MPEDMELRAKEYLSREQLALLQRGENNVSESRVNAGADAPKVTESETRISVFALPGRTKVYAYRKDGRTSRNPSGR